MSALRRCLRPKSEVRCHKVSWRIFSTFWALLLKKKTTSTFLATTPLTDVKDVYFRIHFVTAIVGSESMETDKPKHRKSTIFLQSSPNRHHVPIAKNEMSIIHSEMGGSYCDALRLKSNFAQFSSLILVWHLEWWDSRNFEEDFPLDSPTSAHGLNCQTFSKRMNIFGNHRPCERWQKWFPEQFHFWKISTILKMAPLKVAAHRPIGRNYR